jgi:hypothetical protein
VTGTAQADVEHVILLDNRPTSPGVLAFDITWVTTFKSNTYLCGPVALTVLLAPHAAAKGDLTVTADSLLGKV